MKIIIVEVVQNEYQSVTTITLQDRSHCFMEDCAKYGITSQVMEILKFQGVYGWVDGINGFNEPVKRTYMLIP